MALIKKGIFFKFRDENKNMIINEIKNINTSNLIFSDIVVSIDDGPKYNQNQKNICLGKTTLRNKMNYVQSLKTLNCKYQKEQTITFQITTGINKTNVDINADEQISVLSKENHSSSGFEIGGNVESGIWPFSRILTQLGKKTETDSFTTTTNFNIKLKTKLLSNAFDLSNSEIKQLKLLTEVDLPLQDVIMQPKESVHIITTLDEIEGEVMLILKQFIYNDITAEIILKNN